MCKKIDEFMEENAKLKEALARVEAEPDAGEPWRIEEAALEAAKAIMDMFSAPIHPGREGQRQAQVQCLLIDAMTDAFTPPAAAHGDEAVRKDAERYRWLRGKSSSLALMMVANHSCGELDSEIDAAMRAQAGEGGEV